MSNVNFQQLVEDYSRHKVPAGKTISGIRIGIIFVGIAITVPAFLFGSKLGLQQGFWSSVSAFFIGGFFLAVISAAAGTVGAMTRLTTAMIIQRTFGPVGAGIVNFVITLSWIGWYAVIAVYFGRALSDGLQTLELLTISPKISIVIGSLLMVVVTIFGFKALDKLSLIAVPVMVAFLFLVNFLSTKDISLSSIAAYEGNTLEHISLGAASSLVVGVFIVGATMFPDLSRYAQDPKQARIGAVLSFFLGFPMILIFSAIPSIAAGEADLMAIIAGVGLGISGLIMLIFSTWTTNAYNLYSASLAVSSIITQVPKWQLVILLAFIATISALGGVAEYFIGFITMLGLFIPPIAGVYIAEFLILKHDVDAESPYRYINKSAFIAWVLASSFAYLAFNEIILLTGIPAVDALFIAFGSHVGFSTLFKFLKKKQTFL